MWAVGAFASPADPTHPYAYTIRDDTDVEKVQCTTGVFLNWQDYIGAFLDFNVHGIDIEYTADGNLNFELFTNFDGDGAYQHEGLDRIMNTADDVFLYASDVGLDINGDGYYEIAVVLKDHNAWTGGVSPTNPTLTPGLYNVAPDSTGNPGWDTSEFFLGSQDEIFRYGRSWRNNGNVSPSGVAIQGGTFLDDADVTLTTLVGAGGEPGEGGDPNDPMFRWSFSIAAATIGFESGNTLGVFWAGANCSNDAIAGSVIMNQEPPVIPEPTTLALTGFGLIGLVAIVIKKSRRRRRK
jgi:hypothetical protein